MAAHTAHCVGTLFYTRAVEVHLGGCRRVADVLHVQVDSMRPEYCAIYWDWIMFFLSLVDIALDSSDVRIVLLSPPPPPSLP